MKNLNLYKFEFLLPVLASVLYFFSVKQVIPKVLYVVFATATGIYFFPIKLFFDKIFSGKMLKDKLIELISIMIFSLLAVFSFFLLLGKANATIKTSFEILSILNVLFVIYYSVFDYRKDAFIVHLGFTILTSAVMGV